MHQVNTAYRLFGASLQYTELKSVLQNFLPISISSVSSQKQFVFQSGLYTGYGPIRNGGVRARGNAAVRYRTILRVM